MNNGSSGIRIAHIKTRFLNAGADENTLYSCNWSAERGDDVHLLTGPSIDAEIRARLDPRVTVDTVPDLQNPLSPLRDSRAFLQILAHLRRLKPDIVHTHTSKAGILGRAAARLNGVKGIVHGVHIAPFLNVGPRERFIYLNAERLAARWTDAFIDVSRGMRDAFVNEKLGRPENHLVAYSGMNLDSFRHPEEIEDWRALLGCGAQDPKPPVVLMLAAFEPRKRHVELIGAFDRVLEAVPDARLVLAGDGVERPAVEAARDRSSRPGNIRLLGFNPNPGGLIQLADLCVHCSTREGLPRVVVQYFAGGVPVVMTDLPGIDEVVQNGGNGIVVGPDDFAGLAEAMTRMLTDRQLLIEMTRAALDTDVSAWDVDLMCEDNQMVYDWVLGVRGGALHDQRAGAAHVSQST